MPTTDGMPPDGVPTDGMPPDGTTDGAPTDGTPTDGTPTDGTVVDTPPDTITPDGPPPDGPIVDAPPDTLPPDAPACPGTQERCSGTCTDTNFDPDNCGDCGVDCGANICSFGKCCPATQVNCGGTCIDLDDGGVGGTNCGQCGTTCNAGNTCSDGKCCATGSTNCSGTCRNTDGDVNNCGGCGISCPAGNSCLDGTCCGPGQVNCNGTCVDLDVGGPGKLNCGACGTTCSSTQTCTDGLCCTTGQTSCNGVCTDTETNDLNCGGCGITCGSGQVCSDGDCVQNCVAGTTLCNGQCIPTLNDPQNCGGCGVTCSGGKTCSNSTCSCPANAPDTCGTTCVDQDSDPQNCGGCGIPGAGTNAFECAAGRECTDGTCCPIGQTACNGVCTDTASSETNCGACGTSCPVGSECNAGSCDCGFNQVNCDGECVTPGVDKDNCGACGNTCGANEFCVSNGCIGSCPTPTVGCNGECVNTDTDNESCGGCGAQFACAAGTGCSEGTCVPVVSLNPPPAGKCDGGGPPIDVIPGGGGCTGQLAANTFTFALCGCNLIDSTKIITTDGFDSTQGPYVPGQNGAGIGTNSTITSNALITVGGDLFVAKSLATVGDFDIKQRLLLDGALNFSDLVTVREDAFIGGAITRQGSGSFQTVDVLTSPNCPPNNTGGVQYGSCVPQAFDLATLPCDCTAPAPNGTGKIDVRSIVTFHSIAANNDNASIGLNQAVLDNPSGPIRLDLPCGKYYVNSIQGSQPVTIVAHGRVALFIGGSISPSSAVNFDLDPTSTFDVFVGGVQKGTAAGTTIGSPLYPRLTRFFIGSQTTSGTGSCTINSDCTSGVCQGPVGNKSCSGGGNLTNAFEMSGNQFLNGLFYAGFGVVKLSAEMEMFGAVFAKDISSSAAIKVHFDRAAVDLAEECNEVPPSTCNTCKECNGQACGALGFCTTCEDDFDCCAPLRCNQGTCELIP
ncbi:MAG: hypothetical protein H0V17_12005 [Deltaproteobacteria bacterium]|nr:hypothetical protein [Deltaproteobacteria bacterium]